MDSTYQNVDKTAAEMISQRYDGEKQLKFYSINDTELKIIKQLAKKGPQSPSDLADDDIGSYPGVFKYGQTLENKGYIKIIKDVVNQKSKKNIYSLTQDGVILYIHDFYISRTEGDLDTLFKILLKYEDLDPVFAVITSIYKKISEYDDKVEYSISIKLFFSSIYFAIRVIPVALNASNTTDWIQIFRSAVFRCMTNPTYEPFIEGNEVNLQIFYRKLLPDIHTLMRDNQDYWENISEIVSTYIFMNIILPSKALASLTSPDVGSRIMKLLSENPDFGYSMDDLSGIIH